MFSDPAEVLLQRAMCLEIGPAEASDLSTTAALTRTNLLPWDALYPPSGLLKILGESIAFTGATSVHYVGLFNHKILSALCGTPSLRVSAMDMLGAWHNRAELEGRVIVYSEGTPRDCHVWIQDTLDSGSEHPISRCQRSSTLRCIVAVGLAITRVPRLQDFDWTHYRGYVVGIRCA